MLKSEGNHVRKEAALLVTCDENNIYVSHGPVGMLALRQMNLRQRQRPHFQWHRFPLNVEIITLGQPRLWEGS